MPVRAHRRLRPAARTLGAVLIVFAAGAAQAQETGGSAGSDDPGVVVTRKVQPRIAYRGVPLEDNPVHAKATTFPAQVFHETFDGMFDGMAGQLVGDELLGQHGSAGLAGHVGEALTGAGLVPATTMLGPAVQGGVGRVPIGPGATVAGAVGGATAGLGDRIGGVLGAVAPAAALQGGGP